MLGLSVVDSIDMSVFSVPNRHLQGLILRILFVGAVAAVIAGTTYDLPRRAASARIAVEWTHGKVAREGFTSLRSLLTEIERKTTAHSNRISREDAEPLLPARFETAYQDGKLKGHAAGRRVLYEQALFLPSYQLAKENGTWVLPEQSAWDESTIKRDVRHAVHFSRYLADLTQRLSKKADENSTEFDVSQKKISDLLKQHIREQGENIDALEFLTLENIFIGSKSGSFVIFSLERS